MTQIIEGKPQLPPGFCFICELSNPVKYWDTLRDFEGIVREKLDGRKYVCEECIEQGAKALGFVTPKEADKLKADAVSAAKQAKQFQSELEAFKTLKTTLDQLTLATAKPAPKKATAKA